MSFLSGLLIALAAVAGDAPRHVVYVGNLAADCGREYVDCWYRWYVDPLAKRRGMPTTELRGPRRADQPSP